MLIPAIPIATRKIEAIQFKCNSEHDEEHVMRVFALQSTAQSDANERHSFGAIIVIVLII